MAQTQSFFRRCVGEIFADVWTHVLSTTFPPTLRKGHTFRIRLASFCKISLAPNQNVSAVGWCVLVGDIEYQLPHSCLERFSIPKI